MFRVLNIQGVNVVYYIHFYLILLIFILINIFLTLNLKKALQTEQDQMNELGKDHEHALEILDLDRRLFLVYDDNGLTTD